MIIDSHMHIGKILNFNMTEYELVKSLEKYKIDLGIFSCLEPKEFDHNKKLIPFEKQISQKDGNLRALNCAKNNKNTKAQFWIKPHFEGYGDWIEEFLIKNREYFCGLKIHPISVQRKIGEKELIPYIELAEKLNFSFACHTAEDEYSKIENLYEVAKDYPKVNFIAVHMGLNTDNEKSIELISKTKNLYGDTSWVTKEKVLKAIKICGSEKILFGTDGPIAGIDTFQHYKSMIKSFEKILEKKDFENVMYKNAIRIFNLNLK